ncbi:uncharacterized protein LOC143275998 [Babylonia areolata]|uniref:uncharacterized protein LOC143275998 n=1 Tax=Babylonia areolata TaxID=304850 RepID=UPI003FD0729C
MPSHKMRSGIVPCFVIVTTSWIVYKLFIKPFLSPLRKIPGLSYRPIVGNMLDALNEEPMTSSIKWMKELESRLIRFYFLYGEERLLTADPDIVKQICVSKSRNYHHANTSWLLKTLTPKFVLLMNGEPHHNLKRALAPAFNSVSVDGFIEVFDIKAKELVEDWHEQLRLAGGEECTIPAQSSMTHFTLDTICQCAFDYKMNCMQDPHSAGVQHMKKILEGFRLRLIDMIPLMSRLPTKENRERREAIKFFSDTIKNVIKQKRHHSSEQRKKDLLSCLLSAGERFSNDVIYSHVAGFMIAGFETTSTALTWTLLMLAEHPGVQEKARREVRPMVLKNHNVNWLPVRDMTYLTAVIMETLRLFPPVPTHFRRAVSDDVIQGHNIPAGTVIGLCSGALHRLPENWPEPDLFKPERFLEPYNKFAYLPFSMGPYKCIGEAFAMNEMKVILAHLLTNFCFTLPPGYKYRRIRQLTMQPSPPLSLIVSLA